MALDRPALAAAGLKLLDACVISTSEGGRGSNFVAAFKVSSSLFTIVCYSHGHGYCPRHPKARSVVECLPRVSLLSEYSGQQEVHWVEFRKPSRNTGLEKR